jgi:hypothetical protein
MDIEYELRGVRFRWNEDKAKLNAEKHGVSFGQAAQVFSIRSCDTSTLRETENNAMEPWDATSIFEPCSSSICWSRTNTFESFRLERPSPMKGRTMKMETIKRRLAKDRPMVSVTLRMPEDVIVDMKRIAPLKGFSGYQTLMRSYVGAGVREDLERFEGSAIGRLIERLRESGVPEETLIKAASDVAKFDG